MSNFSFNVCPYCFENKEHTSLNDISQDLLPQNYCYVVCAMDGLSATLCANVTTVAEVEIWLSEFHCRSQMTFRVERNRLGANAKGNLLNCDYRCMHNTRSTATSWTKHASRNTGCTATMKLLLKKTAFGVKRGGNERKSRSSNPHIPSYPFRIILNLNHNHPIVAGDVLRHRDVGPEAREKITHLLQMNHSPSAALDILKYDLQTEHPDDYIVYAGDRYHCPDPQWCYKLYYKMFEKEYGPSSGTLEIAELQRLVEKCNAELCSQESSDPFHSGNERYLEMDVDGDDVIVVICTPLMKRVHHYVTHSAEMVFVDAGGNMDRHNMRVFLLMTYSVAGGLPLGVLITTNEQAATITRALHLYNRLLDSACFYRRGFAGPMLFMTDDSAAERAALQNVYPESTRLLCTFHVLQAFWRFVWDAHSAVAKNDRPYLFNIVKSMVYADSEVSLQTMYDEAMADGLVVAHPAVHRRLQALFARRAEWAICCRSDLPTRDNNTNNYCERAMRVLKDSVLHRTKAYNVPQLVDFIITRFEDYYQRRLQDVANNRLDNLRLSRFLPTASNIDIAKIVTLSTSLYEVPSETRPDISYTVDMHLGSCSCKQGSTGGPCKHQSAVMMAFKERCSNFLPVNDPSTRQLLYAIATGNSSLPIDWFKSLAPQLDIPPSATESLETVDPVCWPSSSSSGVAVSSVGESSRVEMEQATRVQETTFEDDAMCAVFERFDAFCSRIKVMCGQDKASLGPALMSFCKQGESLCTTSAMATALHTFGKYSGAAAALNSKRRNIASLKRIGVQPTAVARRKMVVGGRKRMHLGRPPKSSMVAEHCYESGRQRGGLSRQVWPRRSAPHSLANVVANVEPLGKTHSAK